MKILLVTDAWHPQMNGVVRTLDTTVSTLRARGHTVEVIAPSDGYWTLPLPTYPDIRLALFAKRDVERRIVQFGPEAIHIATEGPLGQAARSLCLRWGMPFTTSYHTKFPEYIKARVPFIPMSVTYRFVRDFHNKGGRTMVTTPSMAEFLKDKDFTGLGVWARGVDTDMFHPDKRAEPGSQDDVYADLPRPVFVNVGRVAVEKNIETFLDLDLPGSKVVVGDGPQLAELQKTLSRHPVHGREVRRRPCAPFRRRRRVRLPVPNRHVRPGHHRSHGDGHTGRRLSGQRARRYHSGVRCGRGG